MPMPRALILYHSHHHLNTLRVAQKIAGVLEADLRQPSEVSPEMIREYELIGFGSGVYFGMFHKSLRDWIRGIPAAESTAFRNAFVFSTSGLPWLWRIWHWPFKVLLSRKGFRIVGEFHCSGFDTIGPLQAIGGLNRRHPNADDLQNAAEFARRILHQVGTGP